MSVPGSNLLAQALTVIAQQTVLYRQFTGRTVSAQGKFVPSYAAPVEMRGSFQPIKRSLYQQQGLDLQKRYANFYAPAQLFDVGRGVAGDQFLFDSRLWQCESLTPWFAIDGWVGVLAIDVGPAPNVGFGSFVQPTQVFEAHGVTVSSGAGSFVQQAEQFNSSGSPVNAGSGSFVQPAQEFSATGTPVNAGVASFEQEPQDFLSQGEVVNDFYFTDIPNIRDFGIRNLANMRTVAGGATPPVNVGDSVGEWRGELGNVVLQESTSGWRPELGAEGVRFYTAGSGTKRLRSSSGISRNSSLAVGMFVITDLAGSYSDFIGASMRTTSVIDNGPAAATTSTNIQSRCRSTSSGSTIPSGTTAAGRHCYGFSFAGGSPANYTVWADSTKVLNANVGSSSNTDDIFELAGAAGAKDGTVVAWGVVYGEISDADWAKIVALAPTL